MATLYAIGKTGLTYGIGTYGEILHNHRGNVTVGKYCSIARNVSAIILADHRMDWISTYPFLRFMKNDKKSGMTEYEDIVIGNDVWIGQNAIFLEGAKVGDGSIIGAFSVVAGNIEPYSVVIGNPARVLRKRFSQETIDALLEIKWWDWPKEKILEFIPLMCSSNIEEFVRQARNGKYEGPS